MGWAQGGQGLLTSLLSPLRQPHRYRWPAKSRSSLSHSPCACSGKSTQQLALCHHQPQFLLIPLALHSAKVQRSVQPSFPPSLFPSFPLPPVPSSFPKPPGPGAAGSGANPFSLFIRWLISSRASLANFHGYRTGFRPLCRKKSVSEPLFSLLKWAGGWGAIPSRNGVLFCLSVAVRNTFAPGEPL